MSLSSEDCLSEEQSEMLQEESSEEEVASEDKEQVGQVISEESECTEAEVGKGCSREEKDGIRERQDHSRGERDGTCSRHEDRSRGGQDDTRKHHSRRERDDTCGRHGDRSRGDMIPLDSIPCWRWNDLGSAFVPNHGNAKMKPVDFERWFPHSFQTCVWLGTATPSHNSQQKAAKGKPKRPDGWHDDRSRGNKWQGWQEWPDGWHGDRSRGNE